MTDMNEDLNTRIYKLGHKMHLLFLYVCYDVRWVGEGGFAVVRTKNLLVNKIFFENCWLGG